MPHYITNTGTNKILRTNKSEHGTTGNVYLRIKFQGPPTPQMTVFSKFYGLAQNQQQVTDSLIHLDHMLMFNGSCDPSRVGFVTHFN